jgi:hypothetical protein
MQTRIAFTLALFVLGADLAGCAFSTTPKVSVVPSGSGVTAAPKPAGCPIPFFRAPPADRPYDELASLHFTTALFWGGDPAEAQAAMRDKACALGADAVLVTQEFQPGVPGGDGKPPTMAGSAIRYRPTAEPAR